ncbi:ATP-binding protein [Rhodovastum sp. RN2-1]|uniref:histidine kinase n=2 Tax=Limobrevibacterium gyesilva TaxID=2991712 RepID=A0AA41YPN1_9PROT|nr:ATP-binding protein [Limobrevibacterium gyesilva]
MGGDGLDTLTAELAALRGENAMLRETLDAIDGTVAVYGPDLRYRFGNRRYHELFPHLPPDEMLAGRHYADVLALSIDAGTVADRSAYADPQAFIARRVAEIGDRDRKSRELYNKKTDTWALIRVKWTPTGNRVALRVDITELKRLQQELLRSQRMETIGRISGGVAHDFNNLLTVIIGNLEMIRLRPDDPARVRARSAAALAAAEAGAQLIRQLLTFAQRDIARPRIVNPNVLLAGMADLLRRTIGQAIPLAMALGPDVGSANIDASQFESAIVNLLLNAREAVVAVRGIDATGAITLTTRNEGRDMIAVSVSDTGAGMTEDVAAQAFEPFFTTKPMGTASGLGLSQVYGFAAGAGGQARIDSAPGRGTTITLLLPRAAPANESQGVSAPP